MAFLVYRPVMRLFKCVGGADVFWPLETVEQQTLSSLGNENELPISVSEDVLDLGPPQKHVK